MRPCRLGPFLLLAACGAPSGETMTASAGITSVSASASGDTSTSGATSAPTSGGPAPTTSTASATATDGDTTTGSASTTATGTTTDSGDSTTGDPATSATAASTDLTATTESGTTGVPCPIGQEGCPCGQPDACAGDLVCQGGVCEPAPPPVCGDGVVEGGELCDDGNQTQGDGCDNDCTPSQAPADDPCGFPSGDGVWLEIDYSNAFTATSPDWTYSATPGWGEADWAPQGESWPEVWDVFNNVEVIDDQIGTVALVDSGGALQIMFGIAGLTYDQATVCVQGRSYSVGSSVTFTVQDQLNQCGDTGMMANDWSIHSTGVDLGTCVVQNNEFQAIRIFPSGGSGALSLTRLRLTLHGAVY